MYILLLKTLEILKKNFFLNIYWRNYKEKKSIPHFEPARTGQAACLVNISPSPFLCKLYQNAAVLCTIKKDIYS